MSLVHEVTPPRFFARLRVPWAAPTSAEYFCAERVALWRKNGRSKCSREIWVTELRTRGQRPASALMIHPGSLLSRNPPQLNFTLTDISLSLSLSSPRLESRPRLLRWNEGIEASIRLQETVRFSIEFEDSKHFEHASGSYETTTSRSRTILSFLDWRIGRTWHSYERVSSEFEKFWISWFSFFFFLNCFIGMLYIVRIETLKYLDILFYNPISDILVIGCFTDEI